MACSANDTKFTAIRRSVSTFLDWLRNGRGLPRLSRGRDEISVTRRVRL
jgi:hypothetical protein